MKDYKPLLLELLTAPITIQASLKNAVNPNANTAQLEYYAMKTLFGIIVITALVSMIYISIFYVNANCAKKYCGVFNIEYQMGENCC